MSLREQRTSDAHVLYCLRRNAILELCPPVLSAEQAQDWASRHTVDSMFERLRQTEGWVDEREGTVVGWVCLKVDYIDGLYVDPHHAGTGIGSNLLRYLEGELTTRGIASVRTDASLNARDFYVRRGYEPIGSQGSGDTLSLAKTLMAAHGGIQRALERTP
jgi:putative acetyltransferase